MKYDVLIVGAGVTGALLFLSLKNKNIDVGLIDGDLVGNADGLADGLADGRSEGASVGVCVGIAVGI